MCERVSVTSVNRGRRSPSAPFPSGIGHSAGTSTHDNNHHNHDYSAQDFEPAETDIGTTTAEQNNGGYNAVDSIGHPIQTNGGTCRDARLRDCGESRMISLQSCIDCYFKRVAIGHEFAAMRTDNFKCGRIGRHECEGAKISLASLNSVMI